MKVCGHEIIPQFPKNKRGKEFVLENIKNVPLFLVNFYFYVGSTFLTSRCKLFTCSFLYNSLVRFRRSSPKNIYRNT